MSLQQGRITQGMGSQTTAVWMDAQEHCCMSMWIMAFSLDVPEIIANCVRAHQIGLTVRLIIDLEQAQHFGMRSALKTLQDAGIRIRGIRKPWMRYDKDREMYVVLDDQERDYQPREQAYRGNHHYKFMIVDCEDPFSDHERGWGYTTEPESCGVVTGSFNCLLYTSPSPRDA